jgi:hypothetical protein
VAKGKMRSGQERNRPEVDAAKDPVRPEQPGHARMRGPEERTTAENLLGEETRASDELLGDDSRSSDELLAAAAEGAQTDLVSDRIADELGANESEETGGATVPSDDEGVEEESGAETGVETPSRGLQGAAKNAAAPGLGRTTHLAGAADTGDVDEGVDVPAGREGASALGAGRPAADEELGEGEGPTGGEWPDAEALERKEAWEHAPDLEKTAMQLERGEREGTSYSVHRPADEAAYDELSNTAYDEVGDEDEDAEERGARMVSQERTTIVKPPGAIETSAIGSSRPMSQGQAMQERGETEPPPDSVLEVERADTTGDDGAPKKKTRKKTSRAKKDTAMAGDEPETTGGTRRRQSRRAASEKAKKGAQEKSETP